ncbi:P-II family nitrogen regulator [Qipengyuania thermophila]|uniref:P-II family nitrogen regulator n=1 Tax=Qipengyuania thermophila TaxID=2509361 RepID=UPI0013EAE3E7|nr:DUF190 domain-containing protein [Qipengyuania thermophila]
MNDNPTLSSMKKIEVVVHAADHRLIESALAEAGIAGWTMIRDVAGMGHSGFHQGRTIFSDETGLVMFVGVGPSERVRQAADTLRGFFASHAGVLFLSDVEVMRSDYFRAD